MKPVVILVLASLLALGAAVAGVESRFEISAETGLPTILSGPELKQISNTAVRVGVMPTKDFQLTATWTNWDGTLSSTDELSVYFSKLYNKGFKRPDQVKFRYAKMDKRNLTLDQYELGIAKSIPIAEKHWESYVGVGMGMQRASADITWVGYTASPSNPDAKPFYKDTTNEFLMTVRGGIRYAFFDWFALQANLKWIPIGKIFTQNYNGMELNAGVVFRFGKV